MSKAQKWIPGMRTTSGIRVLAVDDDGVVHGWSEREWSPAYVYEIDEPDRDDPATVGCLEFIVRRSFLPTRTIDD